MPKTRKKQDYDNKYVKEHYKPYYLRLSFEKEAEIINHLDRQQNKNEYLKQLIVNDMKTQPE